MRKHKEPRPKIIRACTVSNSIPFFSDLIPDLTTKYDIIVLSSPEGDYWSCLDPYGDTIKRVKIPMKRNISFIRDCIAFISIIKLFIVEKPRMIHSMTPKAGLLCMMAAWIARVPVRIHTFTGLVFPTTKGLKRRILMATDWLTCACATHIIPEGEGVKRDLINNGITHKPINVLGFGSCQGIDLSRFDCTNEVMEKALLIKKKNIFTFIAIGRLVHDKGISELVSAFKKLNIENPNCRLLLVGRYEQELDPLNNATINEINLNPAIEAVGSQNDVRPWLAASDCAILASYREGFPNVVLEAAAMGLPQIVTDINGANEIIEEGKSGTIIPPQDTNALYHAMKRMMTESGWRKSLAANARTSVASRFDQHFVRECLYHFYDQII